MLSYLALGDSYTIGEQVPFTENFPFRLVGDLRVAGIDVADPVIVATTGWTTDELAAAIMERKIRETFSFVTLLIGVNNQYRGRSVENYKEEFRGLLQTAIHFAGGDPLHVFVVSIPDWGATPFAEGRDRVQIAKEIDDYNTTKQAITVSMGCHYTEITESTREHGQDPAYLAPDGLHPSAKEYAIWAHRLAPLVTQYCMQ